MKGVIPLLCILFYITACSERGYVHPGDSHSFADWNDTLFELVEANDFIHADTLSEWLIAKTSEAENYEQLINARTNTAISYLQRRQSEKALEMLFKNMEVIEQHGTVRQQAYALVQLTNVYTSEGQNRKALETINEAVRLIPEINHPRTEASVFATKAAVISDSDPTQSLQLNYQALDVFLQEDDRRNEAISRNNIGLRYHSQEDYESALSEFEKAILINTELDHQTELAINYNNISNTLSYMGDKMAAADYLLKAIEINRRLGVMPRLIQNNYNLAQIHMDIENYDVAYEFFSEGYEESKSIGFLPGIMYHSAGLAKVVLELGKYSEVPQYLEKSRELAERMENLRIAGISWETEAALLEKTGDFQGAVAALRMEKILSDSLENVQRKKDFEELRLSYEVDLVDAENEFLRQELLYQERMSRIQQWALFLLLGGVFTIIFLFVQIYRSRFRLQEAYQELEEKNKLITAKNRQLVELNNELKQLNNDKDQLIKIIVHDLRNPLFGVIGFLEVISETVTDGSERKHLDMALKSAHKLNGMINSLLDVHTLEKDEDYQITEEAAVDVIIESATAGFRTLAEKKQIAMDVEESGLQVETHSPYLVRIIENLVSNAIKFSSANSRITVSAGKSAPDHWQLIVADEGPGISEQDKKKMFQMFGKLSARPTGGENSTGLGLYAVNILVDRLGGSIIVVTKPGKGSQFICEFPIRLTSTQNADKTERQEHFQEA